MGQFFSPGSKTEGSILRSLSAQDSEQALKGMQGLFVQIREWQVEVGGPQKISTGSVLDLANAMSAPFQTEHLIGYLRLAAVDHLAALASLMVDAKAQHILAPYSLIRSALEVASTALWVLSDQDPRSIAIKTLKQEHANLNDLEKANTTLGVPADDLVARRERLNDVVLRNGMKKDGIKAATPGVLATLERTAAAYELGKDPVLMWQMCSGATHGRQWITGFLTLMQAQDDGTSEVISGQLVSNEQALFIATYVACQLVRRLDTVQAKLSGTEGHAGESFFRKNDSGLVLPRPGIYLPGGRPLRGRSASM